MLLNLFEAAQNFFCNTEFRVLAKLHSTTFCFGCRKSGTKIVGMDCCWFDSGCWLIPFGNSKRTQFLCKQISRTAMEKASPCAPQNRKCTYKYMKFVISIEQAKAAHRALAHSKSKNEIYIPEYNIK